MPATAAFHCNLPAHHRHYHDNSRCVAGRDVPPDKRLPGTGNKPHCPYCANLNAAGK
jgi:hypothetical protein